MIKNKILFSPFYLDRDSKKIQILVFKMKKIMQFPKFKIIKSMNLSLIYKMIKTLLILILKKFYKKN